MLDLDFSRALARTGFKHRIHEGGDGAMVFKLADRSGHVRLTRREWNEVGTFFEDECRPIARRAKWALVLYLPCWVAMIALLNTPPLWWLVHQLPRALASAFLLGTLFLTPVAIYLWQSHHVGRISATIEATLGQRPRMPAPPPDASRVPRWLDIAMLLLVGPWLLIALIGELRPGIFRNTPLTNAHLGPFAVAGFAVLAFRLSWPRLARWWMDRRPA